MLDNPHIHRVRDLASEIAEQNAVMREVAEKSLETLRTSEHLLRPQDLRANSQRGQAARDVLMKKAREIETAAHIDDWVNSPGLQPAK